MGPICECGCGEYLPDGSTRKYKRGHRPGYIPSGTGQRRVNTPQNRNPWTVVTPDNAESIPADVKQNAFWEIGEDGQFSIQDAAQQIPNDPDPWGDKEQKITPFDIKITASVKRDIEGKLAFMMGMSANLWQMVDPTCGTALLQNTPNICKALVPIMCQSQDVVRWFQKAGNFSMYLNLVMAVFPVLSTIYAHHLSRTIGHGGQSVNGHSANSTIPESAYGVN
jgi:hypothetical protein